MKKIILGFALAALAFTSCSDNIYRENYDASMREELMLRQAYEELQAIKRNGKVQTTTTTTTTTTPVTTTTTNQNYNDRQETLTVVGSGTISTYNVVCGSFGVQDNALKLQKTLINKGYNCVIARNEQGMYRVIAATFSDRTPAVTSRDNLRATYPDAWLLINKR